MSVFQRPLRVVSIGRTGLLLAALLPAVMAWPNARAASEEIVFSDGFEEAPTIRDLLKRDRSRWTNSQRTPSGNGLTLVTEPSHSGTALHFYALPSTAAVSKADIERALPDLVAGDQLSISAWFYAKSGQSLDNVFILDLECHTCWPESSPGIRVHLKGHGGTPVVERGKIRLPSLRNEQMSAAVSFPRDRWVHVEWTTILAPDSLGRSAIAFDGKTVFSARGATFPDPANLARFGIVMRKLAYERFQIGITANSSPNPVDLVIDSVEVRVVRANASASR
jgi:hypothetical protein